MGALPTGGASSPSSGTLSQTSPCNILSREKSCFPYVSQPAGGKAGSQSSIPSARPGPLRTPWRAGPVPGVCVQPTPVHQQVRALPALVSPSAEGHVVFVSVTHTCMCEDPRGVCIHMCGLSQTEHLQDWGFSWLLRPGAQTQSSGDTAGQSSLPTPQECLGGSGLVHLCVCVSSLWCLPLSGPRGDTPICLESGPGRW